MNDQASATGVSVIICCYNSEQRIKPTLEALARQKVSPLLNWELIIVNNGCDDNTMLVVESLWPSLNSHIRLTIVVEPRPGLSFARRTGIGYAHYSFVLFCDDDNWLADNYVEGIFQVLNEHPEITACGGQGVPVFESAEPSWFQDYYEVFAVGDQSLNEENGRLLSLYGAGLAVRKSSVESLFRSGFNPLLTDRAGKSLSSAGDTELCYAITLAKGQLFFDRRLHFDHYIPRHRATWQYVQDMFKSYGSDAPVRNLYYSYLTRRKSFLLVRNYYGHLLLALVRLIKYAIYPPKKRGRRIYISWSVAYIRQLLKMKKSYHPLNESIAGIALSPLRNHQPNLSLPSSLFVTAYE